MWVRLAFKWLVTQRHPDLGLLVRLTELRKKIEREGEGRCPNLDLENEQVKKKEKKAEVRTWYCLRDTETGGLIEDMTVCSDCVAHLSLIYAPVQNIFSAAVRGEKVLAMCDMWDRGYGNDRFWEYIDHFNAVAEMAVEMGRLDVAPLIEFVKKWAPIPYCRRASKVTGVNCYKLPSVVSEWAACENCYLEHIEPLLSASPHAAVLSRIEKSKIPSPTPWKCCMYSPRLRQHFAEAMASNDLVAFNQKLQKREEKFAETMIKLERLNMQHAQQKAQAETLVQLAMISQQTRAVDIASGGGYYYAS